MPSTPEVKPTPSLAHDGVMLGFLISAVLSQAPAYPAVLADKGCATCHLASHPKHDEAALKIFDLGRSDWAKKLEAKRVPKFEGRLRSKASQAEIAEVNEFIARARSEAKLR